MAPLLLELVLENSGINGACPLDDVVEAAGVCADTMPAGIARDAIKRERGFMVHSLLIEKSPNRQGIS